MLTEGIDRSLLFSPGFVASEDSVLTRRAPVEAYLGITSSTATKRNEVDAACALRRKAGEKGRLVDYPSTSCVKQFRSLLADIGWAPDRKSDRMLV